MSGGPKLLAELARKFEICGRNRLGDCHVTPCETRRAAALTSCLV
jgi:hypothetical protein